MKNLADLDAAIAGDAALEANLETTLAANTAALAEIFSRLAVPDDLLQKVDDLLERNAALVVVVARLKENPAAPSTAEAVAGGAVRTPLTPPPAVAPIPDAVAPPVVPAAPLTHETERQPVTSVVGTAPAPDPHAGHDPGDVHPGEERDEPVEVDYSGGQDGGEPPSTLAESAPASVTTPAVASDAPAAPYDALGASPTAAQESAFDNDAHMG